jgi:hypothetical protein
LLILGRAEYVIRFTLCSFVLRVLFDRRNFGNQLKLQMRITQRLAESGQIPIHRGFADWRRFSVTPPSRLLQSPSFERFDVSFVDLVEREISPRTVTEQFPIALLIKLDSAILFRFGCANPLVESYLELSQCRNALGLFITRGRVSRGLGFFQIRSLANNASSCRTGDSFRFAPIVDPCRAVVFLASILGSRVEINERIHSELQRIGLVSNEEHRIRTLVPRQDLTGADRTWAERYEMGDVLRYSRASKETGIGKGAYAQVKSIDAPKNRLTVKLQDGTQRTYDPRRQQDVSVFREEMRSFSVGDRIQFTAPANELKVANRELGTIESIDGDGRLRLTMDLGRTVELDPRKHPHLDHGYAMTSHSSQGQTADRVLIHVDTELGAKDLLNSRMAYVSVSRGRYDAQIYTNNAETLGQELSRDVSHSHAIQQEPVAHKIEPGTTHTNQISQGFGLGL